MPNLLWIIPDTLLTKFKLIQSIKTETKEGANLNKEKPVIIRFVQDFIKEWKSNQADP